METDFGLSTRSCCCFFEWLTSCNNLVKYVQLRHNDDRNDAFFVLAFKSFPS